MTEESKKNNKDVRDIEIIQETVDNNDAFAIIKTDEPTNTNEISEIQQPITILEEPLEPQKTNFLQKVKDKWTQTNNWLKKHIVLYRSLQVIGCIVLLVAAIAITSITTYFTYIQIRYQRLGEEQLNIERNRTWYLTTEKEYTALTMDIGYGIHTPDFTYYFDEGKMANGQTTKGEHNFGISATAVLENMMAIHDYVRNLNLDFYVFQNVDVASTRSHMVNGYEILNEALARYSRIAARYHHTQYLFYPLCHEVGLINSDLMTYSRYKTTYGFRKQLPIDENLFSRVSSIDNAFSAAFMPVNGSDGKYLVLVNINLDKDEKTRNKQIETLNTFILDEYDYGNYVIIGGNFNSDTAEDPGQFTGEQQQPKWLTNFDESLLADGFTFIHPNNEEDVANYHQADIPYEEGVSYESHINGFVVSNNIEANALILDTDYEYSNHNPVQLSFTLKKVEKS